MARKTNKTDHVLSLLSGGDYSADKENEQKEKQENGSPAFVPEKHSGNVHVVLAAGEDPLAEIVKDKLLEELQEEASQKELIQEEKELIQERIPQNEVLQKDAASSRTDEKTETPAEREGQQVPEEEAVQINSNEPPVVLTGHTAEGETNESDTNSAAPEEPEQPAEMDGYVFYNIMEKIVQNKAMVYMKRFGNCTCKRCEADTIALALSKLPPKYVVVKIDSVSPLINFYEDHFAGQIIVEITKACIVVDKNPRH